MRARSSIAIAAATWLALVAGACSLNPQPLPPETSNQDGSTGDTTGSDGGGGGAHDTGSFGDASNTRDVGPLPPPNDAASDAPIGAGDGGDAASDASSDAPDGD